MPSRRRSFSVALVGPDGAGKSTILRALPRRLPFSVATVYMGVNLEASRLMLPTTRAILALKRARGRRPDMAPSAASDADPPHTPLRRARRAARSFVSLANWVAEEWFRQVVAWYHMGRGRVVIFDRHFFCDFHAYDVAPLYGKRSLAGRVHGFLLSRVYPKPDLVVCLDAPVEVLLSRKGEASAEFLERRRLEYLRLEEALASFSIVDASRPTNTVLDEVAGLIVDFYRSRVATPTAQ